MHFQKWLLIVSVFFFIGLIPAYVIYVIDPLMVFRKSECFLNYCQEERYLNPGIATTHSYDTAVIGTSMTAEFLTKDFEKILNMNVVNLTSPGATSYELKIILDNVLRHKKAKNIIYCLDIFSFSDEKQEAFSDNYDFPIYLYESGIKKYIKYLTNLDVLHMSYQIFYAYVMGKNYSETCQQLDLSRSRIKKVGQQVVFSKEKVIEDYKKSLNKKENFCFEFLTRNFDKNLLSIISNNKDIEFYIYYPPYSKYYWLSIKNRGYLDIIEKFKTYVDSKLKVFKNVRIYDFHTASELTSDYKNYRDMMHHSPIISQKILFLIKKDMHKFNPHTHIDLNDIK